MDTKYNIRRIDKSDFEFIYNSLCDLENEILEKTIFEKIFNENIDKPNYLYLIAENEYEKVGFITFHTQNLLHHCGLVGEIQEFYIIPNFRNIGIGRQLIGNVINFADQNKLKSIEVTTNRKRIENIAIYENLGFDLTHNKFTIYK
jgi:(aminoalkyl)phosphonate N-acetyltransferase